MSELTHAALSALPPALQTMARAHVAAHPADDLGELVSELYIAATELTAADAAAVFARARSRMRRFTQNPAHYGSALDTERCDIDADAEASALRYADVVRETARLQHVSVRRAQQLVRATLARVRQGDLFAAVCDEEVVA